MRVKPIKLILFLGLFLTVLNYCSDDNGNETTDGGSDLSNTNDLSNTDDLSNNNDTNETNDESTSNDFIENDTSSDFNNTQDNYVNDLITQDSYLDILSDLNNIDALFDTIVNEDVINDVIVDNASTDTDGCNLNKTFEAESGNLSSPMEIIDKSGAKIIVTNTDRSGSATYNIDIPCEGDYYLWGKIWWTNFEHNSMFVQWDDGEQYVWDYLECRNSTQDFHWDDVSIRSINTDHCSYATNPGVFHLTAGSHVLVINGRETNSPVDKFIITDNPLFLPQ